jgi:hypothetical protein
MKSLMGLFLLVAFAMSFAAAPSAPTLYGPLIGESNYLVTYPYTVGSSQGFTTAKDTLIGADSTRLINKMELKPGYVYYVNLVDSLVDTVKLRQDVYGLDGSTLISSTMVDSIKSGSGTSTSINYQTVALTANSTVFGSKVSLVGITVGGSLGTLKAIIKYLSVVRIKSSLAK